MTYFKHIIFLILSITLWDNGNSALAQNIIERTAKYAPEMPDSLLQISRCGFSNESQTSLDIFLKIEAKGIGFNIHSAKVQFGDSIYESLTPLTINVGRNDISDSLIIWNCTVRFPYHDTFTKNDTWIISTSHGQFTGSLLSTLPNIKNEPSEYKNLNLTVFLYLIWAGGIFASCVYFIRRNNKKHDEERLRLILEHESISHTNNDLRNKIERLYSERWKTFNKFCEEYYIKKDTGNVRISIHRELEKFIEDIKSRKFLNELESLINTYNDDLMKRVQAQIPSLTRKEVVFLIYLYSGFSPSAICLFTDTKIKNFYNRRTRLKEKIISSGAIDRELFASKINNSTKTE